MNQPLEYSPWGYARPYDGGFRYNCMMLQVIGLSLLYQVNVAKSVEIQLKLEDSGSPRATSLGYSINDETCEVTGTFMLHCSVLFFLYIY